MRQAGLKPKSHSSGTYWVRANANNGTNSKNKGILVKEDFSLLYKVIETILAIILILVLIMLF